MFDFEIAYFLYKISRILAVFEGNKYKSKAYYNAAMAVDAYDKYTSVLAARNKLTSITGIGESSARLIREIVYTGRCALLEDLEKKYGIYDYSLLLSYGMNDRLKKKLFSFGITDFDLLASAVKNHEFDRFTKSEAASMQAFESNYSKTKGKFLFSYAYCLGNELAAYINEIFAKNSAVLDLSWQDKVEYIHVVCRTSQYQHIKDILTVNPRYNKVEDHNGEITCVVQFGLPVKITFEQVFREIKHEKKLRGDLHMHTVWSDGRHSIEEMAEHAEVLGREYIGITDHSFSLRVANGISEVDAKQQIEKIRELKKTGIKVLAGIEVEVLKDGTLDFSDAILSQFDYVIAGVHTFLNQGPQQLMTRIEKALSNPYVSIFAHPTARLLGRPGILFSDREPYALNFYSILEICKRNNVAIEFNVFPERFDVAEKYFDKIIDGGVKVSVGTDAHSLAHLNCLDYAEIAIAAYPDIKSSILNYMDVNEIMDFFKGQRAGKISGTETRTIVKTHDFNHFFGHNQRIISGEDAVVGIDLTGNEARASGWSVMRGNKVITAMLHSDDDIIKESIKHKPTVVSIDSPLSYPEGRCCVNENCECKKYGIMRYCERLLSAFGIGVYPCLIPSMVNLTTRGIRLAEKFRKLDVKVIESYPGVAQDILSIPRKQNGLQHLKNGYRNFGLTGDYFASVSIKHDELDAIASALVGLFYINGQYVEIGNDKENYLVVPSVAEKPKNPVVLGLTGNIGAGKTTLAEYLKFRHGFRTLRYSKVICELYKCENDRKTLQILGAKIAKEPDKQRELSIALIKQINIAPKYNYVVDGLRHLIDYETLKEQLGERFTLVYIDSSFSNIYNRYRKRYNLKLSKEEFVKIINHESEQDIFQLEFKAATNFFENNRTYKEYFETFENIFKELLCR
ncbi:MAG: PHP domain-containing protein [Spirochaetaceae bacterium]|jgi:histidinol phosphatase-like PHP family hydrolase/predicted nuclease with RNAse H fold/dephospho-CoA kinase|nr:PHP domain-containing protein [Spirochaetaceae bacterium]